MSLRRKVALVLFLAVASFVGLDNYLHKQNFERRFLQSDEDEIVRDLGMARAELNSRAARLAKIAAATASVLEDPARGLQETLPVVAGAETLNLLIAYDLQGWVKYYSALDSEGNPMRLPEIPKERLSEQHPLQLAWSPSSPIVHPKDYSESGFLGTRQGAMLVGHARIEEGPLQGLNLVAGRFLDPETLSDLNHREGAKMDVTLSAAFMMQPESQKLLSDLLSSPLGYVIEARTDSLRNSVLLRDVAEAPVMALHLTLPRIHQGLWREMREYSLLSMAAICIFGPLVLLLFLQWIVTGPLKILTEHSEIVGRESLTASRLNMDRKDEIGVLANAFDSMLEQLEASRQETINAARRAGRQDMSVNVLHNVGNMLNHVSVSATVARDKVRDLPVSDLLAVAGALEANSVDLTNYLLNDPRGKHLPRFLRQLADHMERQSSSLFGDTEQITRGIDDVVALIARLQEADSSKGVIEAFDPTRQIDSSIELCSMGMPEAIHVRIERMSRFDGLVLVDRVKFIEILHAVLTNAFESVLDFDPPDPRIVVKLLPDGARGVLVEVTDNGMGIDPADLTRIFAAGHSLKVGRSGLGLHMASTTANEMHGSLTVQSDGLGEATFVLHLPDCVRVAQAA
ncbi:MAG: ATP-binding protein [Planctomycetota bacterium]